MKQHIFLFQVHKRPELFGRIVRILASPTHHFLVNVDKKSKNYNDFVSAVDGIDNVHFCNKRWNVYHGSSSQFLCTISMIREAMSLPVTFDYFHQVSGQDYPLRTNQQFDSFFESTNCSFMAFEDENYHEDSKVKYHNRVDNWWPNGRSFIERVYSHTIMRILSKMVKRQRISDLWGGWSWFTWSKRTCDFVLEYISNHPGILKRFNYTFCADELIFQTILKPYVADLEIKDHMPLRYVSWAPKRRWAHLQSSVFKLSKDLIDSIHEEGIVAYTS